MQAEHIHICLGVVITSRVRQVSWQFQTCTSSLLRVCACHIRGRVRAWIPQARRGTRTGLREKLLFVTVLPATLAGIKEIHDQLEHAGLLWHRCGLDMAGRYAATAAAAACSMLAAAATALGGGCMCGRPLTLASAIAPSDLHVSLAGLLVSRGGRLRA